MVTMTLYYKYNIVCGLLVNGEYTVTKFCAHPGNRTLVSTVGGYYDTTTPDAQLIAVIL